MKINEVLNGLNEQLSEALKGENESAWEGVWGSMSSPAMMENMLCHREYLDQLMKTCLDLASPEQKTKRVKWLIKKVQSAQIQMQEAKEYGLEIISEHLAKDAARSKDGYQVISACLKENQAYHMNTQKALFKYLCISAVKRLNDKLFSELSALRTEALMSATDFGDRLNEWLAHCCMKVWIEGDIVEKSYEEKKLKMVDELLRLGAKGLFEVNNEPGRKKDCLAIALPGNYHIASRLIDNGFDLTNSPTGYCVYLGHNLWGNESCEVIKKIVSKVFSASFEKEAQQEALEALASSFIKENDLDAWQSFWLDQVNKNQALFECLASWQTKQSGRTQVLSGLDRLNQNIGQGVIEISNEDVFASVYQMVSEQKILEKAVDTNEVNEKPKGFGI